MKRILLLALAFLLCLFVRGQYYQVSVHINAGELKDSLMQDQLGRVEDLVVSGSMNYDDIFLISQSMPKLKYVNLRDVDLDTIPRAAFDGNKNILLFKLPLYIKYLDDYCFDESNIHIEVTGKFPQIGRYTFNYYLSISPDNEFCSEIRGCVYSKDGKVMYRCLHESLVIWIEEGTEVITGKAFEMLELRCIYFPSTLKKIESGAFYCAEMIEYDRNYDDLYEPSIPGCMYFNSSSPPSLAQSLFGLDGYTSKCSIRIPEGSKKLYQESDPQWKNLTIYGENKSDPYYLMVQNRAGGLKSKLTEEQMQKVQNLAIAGSLDDDDFSVIREHMPLLNNVNLRDVDLDTIPVSAFQGNKNISAIRTPLHIKYLDDYSFSESNIKLSVTGEYPQRGDNVGGRGIYLSSDNEFCMKDDYGCTYSIAGKIMYGYDNQDILVLVSEGTEVIAGDVFEWTKIRAISFPSTLLKIERHAFRNAYLADYPEDPNHPLPPMAMGFRSVYPPALDKDVFGLDDYTRGCFIIVPNGSRKLYQDADPQWNLFIICEESEPWPDTGINVLSREGLTAHMVGSSLIMKGEQAITHVSVFDSLGKVIFRESCNDPEVSVPFNGMSQGIYYVRVTYADATCETVKIIN